MTNRAHRQGVFTAQKLVGLLNSEQVILNASGSQQRVGSDGVALFRH